MPDYKHCTLSSKSRKIIYWTNIVRVDEYKSLISDITDDGTYVFLWVHCCHGFELSDWAENKHHNHLEVWSYSHSFQMEWLYSDKDTYDYAYWQFNHLDYVEAEGYRFFENWEEGYPQDMDNLGDDIAYYFNHDLHPEEQMNTMTYWDWQYHFYL